jgi:hypothetical protein
MGTRRQRAAGGVVVHSGIPTASCRKLRLACLRSGHHGLRRAHDPPARKQPSCVCHAAIRIWRWLFGRANAHLHALLNYGKRLSHAKPPQPRGIRLVWSPDACYRSSSPLARTTATQGSIACSDSCSPTAKQGTICRRRAGTTYQHQIHANRYRPIRIGNACGGPLPAPTPALTPVWPGPRDG